MTKKQISPQRVICLHNPSFFSLRVFIWTNIMCCKNWYIYWTELKKLQTKATKKFSVWGRFEWTKCKMKCSTWGPNQSTIFQLLKPRINVFCHWNIKKVTGNVYKRCARVSLLIRDKRFFLMLHACRCASRWCIAITALLCYTPCSPWAMQNKNLI